MPKMRKKSDLPTKICPACQRPFTWRKKWAKVWEEVKYCSTRCRRAIKHSAIQSSKNEGSMGFGTTTEQRG